MAATERAERKAEAAAAAAATAAEVRRTSVCCCNGCKVDIMNYVILTVSNIGEARTFLV